MAEKSWKDGTGESPTPVADRKEDLLHYPFLIRVLVTFTKLNDQSKETKYKEEVIFKLDQHSAKMPWYVLRNYTVPKYLVDRYGPEEVGWQRIYEIKILKLINRNDPNDITDIPLRVMTLEQLAKYCKKWDLGVDVYEFYSVEKAREMVALREEDEKGYQKHLAEYREGKQRSYPELDKMRGDGKAEVADTDEFLELESKTEEESLPKKSKPSEVAEPSEVEKELLKGKGATGPTTGAAPIVSGAGTVNTPSVPGGPAEEKKESKPGDPFAGI